MAVVFQNWYNKNEGRRYPLVDGLISSDTGQIPNDLIVDCNLWVPEIVGTSVWVSSVMVTNNLVTLTIQAANLPISVFTPVASISLVKPIVLYRPYQVKALYPGVTGWFSFGRGIHNNTSMLFSDNTLTEILPKKIQRYSGDTLYGIQKTESQTVLTGLINLKGAGDIVFKVAEREVFDLASVSTGVYSVILVGLTTEGDTKSVHEKYLSPQASRPENGNCEKQPILFINDVGPDCDGNINIDFPIGIPTVIPNGIVLDYPLGFIEVCVNTPGITPRSEKLCDVPVTSDEVIVDIPLVPPPTPLPPDFPNGNPFAVTVCEDFSSGLYNFLDPKPQPPWDRDDLVIDDPIFGVQTKIRMKLDVILRNKTWRLIRNFTLGDHRNRLMQLELQFGNTLTTSDPSGLGVWENIGLIYNYVSQTSYNFVSLIWLGHNAPGVPLANDPRNAMLVIGHKSTSTKHLTPYGYDFQNPPVPTSRGLNDGHFIDTFKFIEIDPTKPYMLQLTTTEGPSGTTTALAEILELDNTPAYVFLDSITNVSSVINVSASSRVGIVGVSTGDVYATFLSVNPVTCNPVILQYS